MDERRRAPGRLEEEILEILSAEKVALTPARVRQAVPGKLAYTTVMTVLSRLHAKGYVQRETAGRGFAYRGVMDGAAVTAHQMGRLLEGTDDRATVLARFVDALSPADEAVLAELLGRVDLDQP